MPEAGEPPPRSLRRRLLWFVGLWVLGVGAVALAAALLKLVAAP